ncbi:MAG: helix-turn-helix domain-containing protein [Spirochaetales bacterium]|nr:helix-turn-helix domain-containing protein [Spirochaetales bacterium]MCF7938713.1 helix-turn-helix domain-containing protein [Spirochaetales bacterium]
MLPEYQLAQIAIMHYEKGMSQQEIAGNLGFSKMTVSRMLQKAKDQNIIKTTISLPFRLREGVGEKLQKKYEIEKAHVVVNDPSTEDSELVGRVWAFYMGITIPEHSILGMGVGNTIGQVVRNLPSTQTDDLHVVQLMGGLSTVSFDNPFTIVQETCRKLNAQGTYFTSFATVENQEVLSSLVYNTPMGRQVFELWKECTMALFGVGTIEHGTLLAPELVRQEEIEELKSKGAIGDILGHSFDENGEFVHTDLEERLVSIPVELLRKIEQRVAVCAGAEKVKALRGALKTGLIQTLVTDEKTAGLLLEADGE